MGQSIRFFFAKVIGLFSRYYPVLVALCLTLYAYAAIEIKSVIDEPSLLAPILDHISGKGFENLTYPEFVYRIYEIPVRIGLFLQTDPLHGLRFANLVLYFLNCLLFYLFSRNLFTQLRATISMVIFALMPAVFYSGVMVKSEGLQICFLLLLLWSTAKVFAEPEKLKWLILCGVITSAGFATKYNPTAFIVVPVALLLAFKEQRSWRKLVIGLTVFGLSSLIVLVVVFPEIFHLLEKWQSLQIDPYFSEGPAVFKSVRDYRNITDSRYLSPLIGTFPFSFGPLVYLLGIAGAMLCVRSKIGLIITLHAFAAYLFTASMTLMKFPHTYSIMSVAVAVNAASCLFWLEKKKPGRNWKIVPLVGLIAFSIYLAPGISQIYYGFLNVFLKAKETTSFFYVTSGMENSQLLPGESVSEKISKNKPAGILLLDSFLLHQCKYNQDLMRKNCDYFKQLDQGIDGYQQAKISEVSFHGKFFVLDSDYSFRFYEFRKRN